MNAEAPTRSIVGTEDNTYCRINTSTVADSGLDSPGQALRDPITAGCRHYREGSRLPTAEKQVDILLTWQDGLIRRHLGTRHPSELDDAEYGEYLVKALRREFPAPPPRRRSPPRRQGPPPLGEETAARLFIAGALLEIAGDRGVDRKLLAREIVRSGRKRDARRRARGSKR